MAIPKVDEYYQFRKHALASLPYKERQYFKSKRALVVAESKEEKETKRSFLKKKSDSPSHYELILKDYNRLVDSFSFEDQNQLRIKEKVFNHELIEVIEFWGCPVNFPAFFDK